MSFIRLSAEEFVYGDDSKELKAGDPVMFAQKMRLIPSIEDLASNANVSWWSPDHKSHKLFKEKGFENYRGRVGIDNVIFNFVIRAGKAQFGDVFYDINLEVDQILPHTKGASEIKESTSKHNIPTSSENVKKIFVFEIREGAKVNEDLLEELSIHDPSADVDKDGNVIVYHRTSAENAEEIYKTGKMTAKEDALFFSTKADGYAGDYGDTVVRLKIPSTILEVNDIFDGEVHFDIPLQYKNGGFSLDVSKYLIDSNNKDGRFSISSENIRYNPDKYTHWLLRHFGLPSGETTVEYYSPQIQEIVKLFNKSGDNAITAQEKLHALALDMADTMRGNLTPWSQEIVDYVKGTKVSLTSTQEDEVRNQFKNLREFANRTGIIVSQNANTTLDEQWEEWAGQYPEWFTPDTSEGDQITRLVLWMLPFMILNQLKKQATPYGATCFFVIVERICKTGKTGEKGYFTPDFVLYVKPILKRIKAQK